jgi:glycerophosphoryl diester phosphodiesterase
MIRLPDIAIYAHRGASAYAPENTLSAFRMAVDHGADAIELDAKLSADGHVIVFHDQTVNRTTGGEGKITQQTLGEIKAYDAGSWFSSQFTSERIPTLDEVFQHVGQKLLVNVELTNYATPNDDLVEKVMESVRIHNMQERVLFSSFHPVTLLKARRLMPEIPAAILATPGWTGALSRSWLGRLMSSEFVHPYLTDVDQAFIDRQHALGRKVNVWTVNDPEDMRRLVRWGVDGIITDDPRLARQVLEESQ